MQVSGQIHILAAYPSVEEPLVYAGQESEWAPRFSMRKDSYLHWEPNLGCPTQSQPLYWMIEIDSKLQRLTVSNTGEWCKKQHRLADTLPKTNKEFLICIGA